MSNKVGVFSFALLAMTSLSAAAGPAEDLAFNVGEHNHDKESVWVIERLVTFHAADKCYAKVADAKSGASTIFASTARYIERYGKAVTGDDWGHIESQNANSKDANRALVDKMITEFAPKFHLTINLEGDDCDASTKALWLKYPNDAVLALVKYPPKAGTVKVVIDITAKAKEVTAVTGKDGSTLTITAPRDIEASGWSGTVEKAMKRVSSKD
jgi:hypothetical protein